MKLLLCMIGICIILVISIISVRTHPLGKEITGAPPYAMEDLEPPQDTFYEWIYNWERPLVPPTVGLQVGHWKNDELPEELSRLRGNTGASGGGKAEWEVNLDIAEKVKKILEEDGIVVNILPATIPPKYWADVFLAIHADGNTNSNVSGYKIASPRRDFTNKSQKLVSMIEEAYGKHTGLILDPNITRNMSGYYAFAFWRYTHAVHPMSVSAIVETGFLTSPSDRRIIVDNSEISAEGISEGIRTYLQSEGLLTQNES